MISRKHLLILNGVLVFAIFVVIYFYTYSASLLYGIFLSQKPPPSGSISSFTALKGSGALYYDYATLLVPYALLNYSFMNITYANLSLTLYPSNPILRIYLLNVSDSCWECSVSFSPELNASLYMYLNESGLLHNSSSFSYVNVTNLPSTPNDSIIVIPSGRMPGALLPNTTRYSTFTLPDMLRRGDVVIYAGRDFSEWMGEGTNNYEFSTSPIVLRELANYSLETVQINATQAASGNSVVKNNTGFNFNSPSFAFTKGSLYGPVAYVHAGNGTLIAFSNLSSSWNTTALEAEDIAMAISRRIWMRHIAFGFSTLNASGNGIVPIFAVNNALQYNQNASSIINASYALVRISLINTKLSHNSEFQFRPSFSSNGSVSTPPLISVSATFPMVISINASNTRIFPISILNSTFANTFSNMPVIHPTPPNRTTLVESLSLKPGLYIATVAGVTGSSALFGIGALNITPINIDFKGDAFSFIVTSAGSPVSGIGYTASIDGAYNKSGITENGAINYTLPAGSVIQYGTHSITLNLLGSYYSYRETYTGNIHIPAFYIEFAIIAAVMLLLNLIVKDPIRDEYFVDVPAFPPASKTVVRMNSESIVNLFDTVDNTFHWRYMPLSSNEIGSGISNNLRYENMPISITFQNLTEILYKLSVSKELDALEDYFMPKRWAALSGHDIEYLVIFRKLRDYLVANSVLFTDLDASESADMTITKGGRPSYIYIYSSIGGMRNIKIDDKSKSYIAFLNDETVSTFTDRLYSSYGAESEALKVAISSSAVQLINIDDLFGVF